jgi:hypothetical protein
MKWFKYVVWDVAVTLYILVSVLVKQNWMYLLLMIYTIVMLIARIAAMSGAKTTKLKRTQRQVPEWFFHVLYAVNVTALIWGGRFVLAVLWAGIWGLAFYTQKKLSRSV